MSYKNANRKKKKVKESLTAEQIADLRETFLLFDKDGDGTVNCEELGTVMRQLGQDPSDEELREMIAEVDEDGSGEIEFEEFCAMMANRINQPIDSPEELIEAFEIFDDEKRGYITMEEFRSVMTTLGEKLSHSDVDEMVTMTGIGKNGKVKYKEFVKLLTKEYYQDKQGSVGLVMYDLTVESVTSWLHIQVQRNKEDSPAQERPNLDEDSPAETDNFAQEVYIDAFREADEDGDGFLSERELGIALRKLGHNPTEVEIRDLILTVDEDENGHLDMNEFMNLMTIKTAAIGEVNDMFKTFDVDKNGFIDWNELKVGMQNLVGHELEDSDIDEMMEEADLDGDGRINYAEFERMMQKNFDEEKGDMEEV
uniref:Calmodulin-like protein 12 n=1 Tax=Crassostrea virginica TaxID=6565 RepID=A0A8B8DUQ9_CRAVI|nr:calmodulin-like protein 12 [Crassostrea virginica]